MRGHTGSLNTCRLRAIKSVPGRFQVKRHSRALAPPESSLFLCVTLKGWCGLGMRLHARSVDEIDAALD